MKGTVYVSIPAIVDSLLAGSAIGAAGSAAERPPLLTPDHEGALRRAVRDALRGVALRLSGFLAGAEIGDDAAILRLQPGVEADGLPVGGIIESIAAARVLGMFHAMANPAAAAACAERAEADTGALLRMLFAASPAPGRIRPYA